MRKMILILATVVMGSVLILGLSSCGDAGGRAKDVAPVFLIVTAESTQINSDLCEDLGDGTFAVTEDETILKARVLSKDPDDIDTSHYMDVIITGYEVSYSRRDTGNAVPKTFVGSLNSYVAFESEIDFPIVYIRASQKEMPPLSYICQYGYEPETGLSEIHTSCKVTVWGQTLAGREVVSNPVNINVNFANWADGDE